jgi:ABC-2 type transport system ATP-binding protein
MSAATDHLPAQRPAPRPSDDGQDGPLAVRVRGLVRRYRGRTAVDALDLDVRRGEVFALLGPNGAGKTTTVEVLEGYRQRDAGEVAVLGEDPARAGRGWRERIGIVLQSSTDQAELTVAELVHHMARYYPDPRDPDELIEAVGLTAQRRTRTRRLSGGQRRRLDVALGIVGRPELVFLDEPTTGFDPEARHAFWALVAGLRDGGTTVLLTTHYLDEAEQLADRVGVIVRGRVVDVAAPAELGTAEQRRVRVHWLEDGRPRHAATDAPTRLVAELAARLAPGGGEVPGLRIVRPSLEEVYLATVAAATLPLVTDPAAQEGSR